jgi:hypothetical protein
MITGICQKHLRNSPPGTFGDTTREAVKQANEHLSKMIICKKHLRNHRQGSCLSLQIYTSQLNGYLQYKKKHLRNSPLGTVGDTTREAVTTVTAHIAGHGSVVPKGKIRHILDTIQFIKEVLADTTYRLVKGQCREGEEWEETAS